jgi:hypothetical protein
MAYSEIIMELFTLVLMNGREYDLTDSEYNAIKGRAGVMFMPRLNLTFNMASVSAIEPKGMGKQIDRSKQIDAVLHDGTRLIKQFGRWFCAEGSRNNQGLLEVEIDPFYYPELKIGILPTPAEYENKFKRLSQPEWITELTNLISTNFELPSLPEGRSGEVGLTKI